MRAWIILFSLGLVALNCTGCSKDEDDDVPSRGHKISMLGEIRQKPDFAQDNNDVPSRSYKISAMGEIRQKPDFAQIEKFIQSTPLKASKTPNIYFIFFDTLRPDYALSYAPSIEKFYKESFSFKQSYGPGNATVYSTYSLHHGTPALAYQSVPEDLKDTDQYGSYYIKALARLGYKLNLYGYYWTCVENPASSGSTWDRFLISFFGWKTRLLDRCKTDFTFDQQFVSGSANRDEMTVEVLEKKLPQEITSPTGNFFLLAFYNNHSPYKWGSLDPTFKETDTAPDWGDKNLYLKSVKSSGLVFQRVMNLIHSLPGADDAIIVLYSDHGESLKEHEIVGHGKSLYNEEIKSLLAFQFGSQSPLNIPQSEEAFASLTDVFPTVFDAMGVSPNLSGHWISGRSLLSHPRNSTVTVKANGVKPTRVMALVNKRMKAGIQVEDPDFYHANSFTLTGLADSQDRPIPFGDSICADKSDFECRNLLLDEFSDAIHDLFPDAKKDLPTIF